MRICYLNHDLNDNTGAGRFGLQLIRCLEHEYSNFHSVPLTAVSSSHARDESVLYPNPLRLLFALPLIRSIFKKCDIVHALDGFPYGVIAAIASFGLGRKLVITAVGTGAVQAFCHPMRGALLRWAYRRADRVVAVSNYTKREILKYVPGLHISVINHAVDAEEFSSLLDAELSEEENLTIERLKPYLLSVGSGKPRKGYEYSFSAFARMGRRFPELTYVAVGYDKGTAMIGALGIADRVSCFVGVRRQFLSALYRNAELFMLLPHEDRGDIEGFGFVFLEAAAAGLPVIGTRGSGAEDAVEHGKNGFLVEPKDAVSAADAGIKILSDRSLRAQFVQGSIDFAKRMNWERVAKKYMTIYELPVFNS